MNWLLLTFLSAITGSFSRILQKVLLKDEQSDTFAFGFVFQMCVAGLFLIYTLITHSFEFPDLSGLLINLIVLTVFYSLANLCIFFAFKHAEAAEVTILLSSSTVWSVIAAVILLGERMKLQNLFGIFLIVCGVLAINYTKSHWKLNKGHLFALVGAVLFGIAFVNDAYIITRYESIPSYMVMAFALPGIMTLVYSPSSVKKIKHFGQLKVLKNLLICSGFYALSALTIFTAFKIGGKASIISPIQQTSLIFTVFFSYVFLKEKDKMLPKIIGTALAFAGVLFLL